MMRIAVLRLRGQLVAGPRGVAGQSNARIRAPISPPPCRKSASPAGNSSVVDRAGPVVGDVIGGTGPLSEAAIGRAARRFGSRTPLGLYQSPVRRVRGGGRGGFCHHPMRAPASPLAPAGGREAAG